MMRISGWLVAVTLAMCGATWLVVTGWRAPRPSVQQAIHHLRRPAADRRGEPGKSLLRRLGAGIEHVDSATVAHLLRSWAQPLRLIGRPLDVHLGLLLVAAVGGLLTPALLLGLAQAAGFIAIGVWVPALVSLVVAVMVPIAVHSEAMARSTDITVNLRHQLSAYLDVVTMLLAGNSGYEGALGGAAAAGDGMLFRELRRRMREVSATGRSLVVALELVADEFAIVELEQVAATATLSAAEGAPVARSLSAKCATLRSTLAAEQEAAARVRNDKVTPPLVGMALLFMALIIYPALDLA